VTSRASLARYAPLGLLFLIAAAAAGIGIEAAREGPSGGGRADGSGAVPGPGHQGVGRGPHGAERAL